MLQVGDGCRLRHSAEMKHQQVGVSCCMLVGACSSPWCHSCQFAQPACTVASNGRMQPTGPGLHATRIVLDKHGLASWGPPLTSRCLQRIYTDLCWLFIGLHGDAAAATQPLSALHSSEHVAGLREAATQHCHLCPHLATLVQTALVQKRRA